MREYEDVDRRQPDFLREDYGRTTAGALVVRDRPSDDYDRMSVRSKPREVDKHELVIRERDMATPKPRIREDYSMRGPSRAQTWEGLDIAVRHEDRGRSQYDGADREEITYRHTDIDRPGWRDDVHKDELIYRREEHGRPPREAAVDRGAVVTRPRERSLPPPAKLVAREREDFVVRRKDRPREVEKEEIIIRRMEREPSPSPPPPPPEPEPVIVRPPIHQEIITHHRHIDHGKWPVKTLTGAAGP